MFKHKNRKSKTQKARVTQEEKGLINLAEHPQVQKNLKPFADKVYVFKQAILSITHKKLIFDKMLNKDDLLDIYNHLKVLFINLIEAISKAILESDYHKNKKGLDSLKSYSIRYAKTLKEVIKLAQKGKMVQAVKKLQSANETLKKRGEKNKSDHPDGNHLTAIYTNENMKIFGSVAQDMEDANAGYAKAKEVLEKENDSVSNDTANSGNPLYISDSTSCENPLYVEHNPFPDPFDQDDSGKYD